MLVRRLSIALFTTVAAVGLPLVVPVAHAQTPVVMATGLDNPRGLAFGPDGAIYVVEAGRGGTGTQCLPNPFGPPGGQRCYGPTGAVTRVVSPGVHGRVLTGLPSLAGPTGAAAIGPHDIDFGFNRAFITVGSGGDPALLAPFKAANINFASLLMISFTGVITPVADFGAYETANNPAGGPIDSNAYGLAILSNRAVVADAGGNSLLQIDPSLTISTLATFANRDAIGPGGITVSMEPVPNSVVEGPDGALYVGELTGFPFPTTSARVYRVPANGGTPTIVAEGFTNIIDVAIGPDGAAYVLEHDVNSLLEPGDIGRLTKIGPFGLRTELAPGLLVSPGKILIGPDNAVYVTVNSTSAGNGQVLRITQ